MPMLTITKTYVNGNTLFQADLDSAFNSITTFLNTTLIDNLNIQTGGIIGSNLANGTIGNAQLGSACVNTANIASSAVTSANIAPLAVQSGMLASSAVTTGNIGPLAIARPQLAALGQQVSTSCGSFSTTSSSYVSVTNLSVTITTSGRPVMLMILPDSTTSNTFLGPTVSNDEQFIQILRAGAAIMTTSITAGTGGVLIPPSIIFMDVVGAGTYTYTVKTKSNTSNSVNVTNSVLVAYEL